MKQSTQSQCTETTQRDGNTCAPYFIHVNVGQKPPQYCKEINLQLKKKKKNPPAMQEAQETYIQSLGCKDLLEEEMSTHSSILAWEIPWTEECGGLQSTGSQKSQT